MIYKDFSCLTACVPDNVNTLNKQFMPDLARKFLTPALFAVILAAGLLVGGAAGTCMLRLYFSGGNPALYLFTETAGEYAYIQTKLRSGNELDRMTAYYALLEYGKLDSAFMIERFEKEQSIHLKRLIVWMMGQSGNSGVTDYIRKKYNSSTPGLKKEMKKTMDRHNAHLGK
jgi:hypothetical protein